METSTRPPLSRLLTFPPELERDFESEKHDERALHFKRCGYLGLVLYDLFLLYHWELTPDAFGLACVLSLAVFTPMLIFTIHVPTRSRSVVFREASWTVMPIVAVGFFMLIATASESPHRALSYFSAILVMVFTTAVQRLRLRFSLVANAGMLMVVGAAVSVSGAFDGHTRLAILVFFAVALVLLAMGAYAFDREGRLAFLAERQTRLLNGELKRVSQIDPLTGLWNRRYLESLMASAWEAAAAEASMAVLLIDVDHFKKFNDAFGHAAGDSCLVAVGRSLSSGIGAEATAVRYGGEEFLVFVPNCDAARARALANLLCADLRRRTILIETGGSAAVTVSVGVAASAAASMTPSALIGAADRALYSAKAEGRDRAVVADPVAGRASHGDDMSQTDASPTGGRRRADTMSTVEASNLDEPPAKAASIAA